MSQLPGKFIVIDGADGAGKTTQLQLLASKLSAEGYAVELADFPQYNTKSAGIIEEYLSGKYGQADDVNPYAASLFYSIDRFDASFQIKEWLKEGKIVISNRYISSNFAHQGGKINNALERKLFFNWLNEIEYKIFNIPKPDIYLILYAEPEISQRLAMQRNREDWLGKTRDIHEENLDHLKKAAQTYLDISQQFPDYRLIRCTRNNDMLPQEDIHYLIWLSVSRILNTNNTKKVLEPQALSEILMNKGVGRPNLPELTAAPKAIIAIPETKTTDNKPNLSEDKTIKTNSIKVERINQSAKLPTRAHAGDAGLDIYASEDCSIPPYCQYPIPTGIKIAIPEGYVGLIWDKSGLASQGYTTMGGVIDSGYHGEIKVIFKNLSEDVYHVENGQKIAQLLVQKIELPTITEEKISEDSQRGTSGFGSSGKY